MISFINACNLFEMMVWAIQVIMENLDFILNKMIHGQSWQGYDENAFYWMSNDLIYWFSGIVVLAMLFPQTHVMNFQYMMKLTYICTISIFVAFACVYI